MFVDNRTFQRLTYRVLDHDPTYTDITAFFRRFRAALNARELRQDPYYTADVRREHPPSSHVRPNPQRTTQANTNGRARGEGG